MGVVLSFNIAALYAINTSFFFEVVPYITDVVTDSAQTKPTRYTLIFCLGESPERVWGQG